MTAKNVLVGRGKSVHAADEMGRTSCGVERPGEGRYMTAPRRTRETDKAVDCMRCLGSGSAAVSRDEIVSAMRTLQKEIGKVAREVIEDAERAVSTGGDDPVQYFVRVDFPIERDADADSWTYEKICFAASQEERLTVEDFNQWKADVDNYAFAVSKSMRQAMQRFFALSR